MHQEEYVYHDKSMHQAESLADPEPMAEAGGEAETGEQGALFMAFCGRS